ncbi:MAG: tRNA-(ms[2]io[6]A)-hydroxylase [Myxococcota bacterium]
MKLLRPTSPEWVRAVLDDFDAFLLDHAANERKASATALHFVAHYPDRPELCEALIAVSIEELEHFSKTHALLRDRGLVLRSDEKDRYVGALLKELRQGRDLYFLDRLLVAGVIEARGCERFGLVAEALSPGPLKEFYEDITRSEARHHGLFLRLARRYFEEAMVRPRLDELLQREADILEALPIRARLH